MSSQESKRVIKGIGFLLVLTLFLIPFVSSLSFSDVIHWIMEKFGVTYDEAIKMVEAGTTHSLTFTAPQSQPQETLTITKTGYEKYIFYNVQANKVADTIRVDADINQTVVNFLRDAYTNPTVGKCNIIKNYLSEDGITPPNCTTIQDTLNDRITNGVKLMRKGIQSGTISINSNHITAVFPADNVQNGELFKIGDNSITIQYQMIQGNILFSDGNLTYEPANFTHLNISDVAPYNSLVGYWSFDSWRSGTKTYDKSDSNNDGTLTNGASIIPNCVYDDCSDFDGTNDYIPTGINNLPSGTSARTIVGWVKLKSYNNYNGLFSYGAVVNNQSFFLTTAPSPNTECGGAGGVGKLFVGGYFNNANACSTGIVPLNQWTQIGATYVGGTVTYYINGVASGTATQSGLNTVLSYAEIGALFDHTVSILYYNGSIDDVMVFNTNLSAQQISDIYNNQSARFKAQGVQTYLQQNISLASGDDKINVTLDFEKNFGSNVQSRLGMWNVTNNYNNSDTNLIAYYHADGDSNDTANDLGTNNCTWTNTAGYTSGIYNNSFRFGANEYLDCGTFTQGKSQTAYTIAAWFKTNSTADTDQNIAGEFTGGTGMFFQNGGTGYGDGDDIAFGFSGTNFVFTNGNILQPNTWYFVVGTFDNSLLASGTTYKYKVYVNGQSVTIANYPSGNASSITNSGNPASNLFLGRINSATAGSQFNGTVDEVMIWNKALSAQEIQSLYIKGRANWQYTPFINSNASFNVTQRIDNLLPEIKLNASPNGFYTPIVFGNTINLSITTFGEPPTIIFDKQTPANITSSNINNFLNISYNITDNIAVNNNNVFLFFKNNNTDPARDNIDLFLNGTSVIGYRNLSYNSLVGDTYTWNIPESRLYPSTFNLYQPTVDNTVHQLVSLNNNDWAMAQLLNVSNATQFNVWDVMVNASTSANQLRFFYCNNTYAGGNPNGNSNCVNFYNTAPTPLFNHTNNQSSHKEIPMAINITTGLVGNVRVTSNSSLLIPGSTAGGGRSVYYVPTKTRDGASQTSANNGNSWTDQAYTFDISLHQFGTTESLYYYVCANDTNLNSACSSVVNDLFELGNQPPSAPQIYSPVSQFYFGPTININYTPAVSPNGNPINYYNITLINATDASFVKVIKTNNSNNLSYVWDISGELDGQYRVNVRAYDNLGQSSLGISQDFNITLDFTAPNVQIISPENGSTISTITPTLNVTTNDIGVLSCKYSTTNGITNITFGLPTTIMTVGTGENVVKVWCNDTVGNVGYNESTFTVSLGAGSLCSVGGYATRNGTSVFIQAFSKDTAGAFASYSISGVCRDRLGNTFTYPTFTTTSTGNYFSNFTYPDSGTCTLQAPSCTGITVGWDVGTTTTTSSSCSVNATSLLSKSSTRPYGQLCSIKEFQ